MSEATIYENNNHMAILSLNRPDATECHERRDETGIGDTLIDFLDDVDSRVMILTAKAQAGLER